MTKKILSQLGHNVRKYGPVNAVAANFNTIMGQMSERSQREKTDFTYAASQICDFLKVALARKISSTPDLGLPAQFNKQILQLNL